MAKCADCPAEISEPDTHCVRHMAWDELHPKDCPCFMCEEDREEVDSEE